MSWRWLRYRKLKAYGYVRHRGPVTRRARQAGVAPSIAAAALQCVTLTRHAPLRLLCPFSFSSAYGYGLGVGDKHIRSAEVQAGRSAARNHQGWRPRFRACFRVRRPCSSCWAPASPPPRWQRSVPRTTPAGRRCLCLVEAPGASSSPTGSV